MAYTETKVMALLGEALTELAQARKALEDIVRMQERSTEFNPPTEISGTALAYAARFIGVLDGIADTARSALRGRDSG